MMWRFQAQSATSPKALLEASKSSVKTMEAIREDNESQMESLGDDDADDDEP
jgi:hypothetical protein